MQLLFGSRLVRRKPSLPRVRAQWRSRLGHQFPFAKPIVLLKMLGLVCNHYHHLLRHPLIAGGIQPCRIYLQFHGISPGFAQPCFSQTTYTQMAMGIRMAMVLILEAHKQCPAYLMVQVFGTMLGFPPNTPPL